MNRQKGQENYNLDMYFLSSGFMIDDLEKKESETLRLWENNFLVDKYTALYHLGFLPKEKWFSLTLEYLHQIAEMLIKKLCQQSEIELSRENIQIDLSESELEQLKDRIPFVIGMEYVDDKWIRNIFDSLLNIYRVEIENFEGTVSRYFAEYNANINVVGRVFFHLVENKDDHFPFAFMATYSTKPIKSKRAVHTPLKNALKEFEGDEKKLLSLISTVIKASEKSSFIASLLENGDLFSPLRLTIDEAYIVLSELENYENAGIMCRIPDWWRKKSNSITLSVTVGQKEPSQIGLNAILDFYPEVLIGDEKISEQELENFLDMAEGLVHFKGKWVEIDKRKMSQLRIAFDKIKKLSNKNILTLKDAMRMELNVESLLNLGTSEIDVSICNGQWFKKMKESLNQSTYINKINIVPSFQATLRDYQVNGYHWLNRMSQLGFGACLADDMGLGKTVQMIAFLEYKRINHGGPVLLILPASLIGNWQKEIERFAPEMPVVILHKSVERKSKSFQNSEAGFLYITTYGMAMRLEELKSKHWELLILDEAQAIKNPGSKQTKAIKTIPAQMRIALTGTPIENRLSDLWSLFDFLNQGLLGTTKEFTDFTKSLPDNTMGYAKLRKMIQPFMLRRLKTDKNIISDLPDKLEITAYPLLTKRQISLYKQLLDHMSKKLNEVDGIQRRGLVLSSIIKFKQICNHPDHYLGGDEYKPELSGKFEQLRGICETILEKREKVLVFTQFREMAQPLADFLKDIFQREGLVLHGGTPINRRSEMVDIFNSEHYVPFMILSLKAGGVGLNLTAANHVVHFDRWWNPAVENQATDRAFRIGQMKNVMVHKFVTKGTVEEKINSIIESKQNLSKELLSVTGEQWITEYSNEELMKIFALSSDL